MSKFIFAAIIRRDHEVDNLQLEELWSLAKNALLPTNIFDLIKPHFNLLPTVRTVYVRLGLIESVKDKHIVKDKILSLLVRGELYTTDFVKHIDADEALIVTSLNELNSALRISYVFCNEKKCRLYSPAREYLSIQRSIIRTVRAHRGIEQKALINNMQGDNRKAIELNLRELLRNKQILRDKQNLYIC